MIRVALESVLGVRPEGDSLVIDPCVPDEWPEYSVRLRIAARSSDAPTHVEVFVRNPERRARRVVRASLNGEPLAVSDGPCRVPLRFGAAKQRIEIELG
jgi:cyclic beta-1,2-glucan synthetase